MAIWRWSSGATVNDLRSHHMSMGWYLQEPIPSNQTKIAHQSSGFEVTCRLSILEFSLTVDGQEQAPRGPFLGALTTASKRIIGRPHPTLDNRLCSSWSPLSLPSFITSCSFVSFASTPSGHAYQWEQSIGSALFLHLRPIEKVCFMEYPNTHIST